MNRNALPAKCFFLLLLFQAAARDVVAQSPGTYLSLIDTLHHNIVDSFYDPASALYYETSGAGLPARRHSYLWPLCALLQAADEEDVLLPGADHMSPVLRAIAQYRSTAPPVPAYQASPVREASDSRYYDDNEWVAIACLDAYGRTRKDTFLGIAKTVYRFIKTGCDTMSGGGIYWREDKKTSKNTCSNGPAILMALQLYRFTGERSYLADAGKWYQWVNAHLRSPGGLFYDNLRIPSLKIDSALYTYNAGTMLQSNVLFFVLTGDRKYLTEAETIAAAAERQFYHSHRLPPNYWFNVVLLRGESALYRVDHRMDHLQFFIDYADRVWNRRSSSGMIGPADKPKKLIDQAAMMEMYGRLAGLQGVMRQRAQHKKQ